jgi:hypothetical protein
MRNILDKICRENQNTIDARKRFAENPAFYEIMWKRMVNTGRPQMGI